MADAGRFSGKNETLCKFLCWRVNTYVMCGRDRFQAAVLNRCYRAR